MIDLEASLRVAIDGAISAIAKGSLRTDPHPTPVSVERKAQVMLQNIIVIALCDRGYIKNKATIYNIFRKSLDIFSLHLHFHLSHAFLFFVRICFASVN